MRLQTKPAAVSFCHGYSHCTDAERCVNITTCLKRLGSPRQTPGRVAALPWCPVTLYHTSCYYLLVRPAAYSVVMSWQNINQEPACVGGSLLRRLTLLCVPSLPSQNHWTWELLEPSACLLKHYAISQQSKQSFLCYSPLRRGINLLHIFSLSLH